MIRLSRSTQTHRTAGIHELGGKAVPRSTRPNRAHGIDELEGKVGHRCPCDESSQQAGQYALATVLGQQLSSTFESLPAENAPAEYEPATRFAFDESSNRWRAKQVLVRIERAVYAKGRTKICQRMWMKTKANADAELMVMKTFVKEDAAPSPPEVFFREALCSTVASAFAADFNALSCTRPISFLPVCVLKLHERDGAFATAEPLVEEAFEKHNGRDGRVLSRDSLPQAFSHFTWEASGGRLLVCGLRGPADSYSAPALLLPRPAHPSAPRGPGAFFGGHRCSFLCRVHALAPANLHPAPTRGAVRWAGEEREEKAWAGQGRRWAAPRTLAKALALALPLANASLPAPAHPTP